MTMTQDGKLDWTEVALFVQREQGRLDPKHYEFINDMAKRVDLGHRAVAGAAQILA
jgi:hypothetical protein